MGETSPAEEIAKRWPGLVAVNCNVSITRNDVISLVLTLAPLEHPRANWSSRHPRPSGILAKRDEPNIQDGSSGSNRATAAGRFLRAASSLTGRTAERSSPRWNA